MIARKKIKDFVFDNWEWLVLILLLIFVFFIRMHFLSVPLERDEGEYAYMGQLILKGIPPYESAYNMKFPGTYYVYAIIMFMFGQTTQGIHFGLMLINILSTILIYFIFSKMINRFIGLITASFFSLISLSFVFLGFAAHATHFVLFFALLGIFLLTLEKTKWYTYLISGMCFSSAILMKQHGVFFVPLGLLLVFSTISKSSYKYYFKLIKSCLFFIIGLILPIIIVGISLVIAGTFARFWFWTMTYASTYAVQGSAHDAFLLLGRMVRYIGITSGLYAIIGSMFLGILVVLFSKKIIEIQGKRLFLIIFFLVSFLTIVPGFYFRPHYFITLIPAATLFSGIFFYWLFILLKNKLLVIFLIIVTLLPFFVKNFDYFFIYNSQEIIRRSYGFMPFVETKEISSYIKEHTSPEDKIFVFGSEPEVYFYTNRMSTTGYIYMYALMEKQPYALSMQKEMIAQVEKSSPKFILFSGERTSWLLNKDSEMFVFSWAQIFFRKYKAVSVIDIYADGSVHKLEGKILETINPFGHYLTLYERLDK